MADQPQQSEQQASLDVISSPVGGGLLSSDKASAQDEAQYLSRWIEDGKILGESVAVTLAFRDFSESDLSDDAINYRVQCQNMVGAIGGFAFSLLFHYALRHQYKRNRSLNPLYRNFKTLASVGSFLGTVLSFFIPLPQGRAQKIFTNICIDVCGLTLGFLGAIPIWAYHRFSPKRYTLEVLYDKVPKDMDIDSNRVYLYTIDDEVEFAAINQKGDIERTRLTPENLAQYEEFKRLLKNKSHTNLLTEDQVNSLFSSLTPLGFPRKTQNPYTKTGNEGWSKYGKTFLVYGANLGQFLGFFYGYFSGTNVIASMAICGGIVGVTSFVTSIFLIPMVNKYYNNVLVTKAKDRFRNNYVRTGITLGLSVGSFLGFLVGTFLFPGVGSVLGMAVGGAFCSLIFGAVIGRYGYNLTHRFHSKSRNLISCHLLVTKEDPKEGELNDLPFDQAAYIRCGCRLFYVNKIRNKVSCVDNMSTEDLQLFDKTLSPTLEGRLLSKEDLEKVADLTGHVHNDTENSWDYCTRGCSYFFAYLGSIIGFLIPIPGGPFVGAALGSAIGGIVGWFAGIEVMKVARTINPIEERAESLSWTQRIATGSGVASIIGAGIGFGIGVLAGGPAGALVGLYLGISIGGFIGGIIGAIYEKNARKIIKEALFGSSVKQTIPANNDDVPPVFRPVPAKASLNSTHAVVIRDLPTVQEGGNEVKANDKEFSYPGISIRRGTVFEKCQYFEKLAKERHMHIPSLERPSTPRHAETY